MFASVDLCERNFFPKQILKLTDEAPSETMAYAAVPDTVRKARFSPSPKRNTSFTVVSTMA